MTNCACLTGYATACNTANDVELAFELAKSERLTNDEFKGFKAKIIVNFSVVDDYFTCSVVDTNTGNRALSSAGSVKIRLSFYHYSVLLS